jgi:hypothetical protein
MKVKTIEEAINQVNALNQERLAGAEAIGRRPGFLRIVYAEKTEDGYTVIICDEAPLLQKSKLKVEEE